MRPVSSAAIIVLTLAATPTILHAQDSGDIRTNDLLSRPLTVMEHILIKLQREAEERAESMARPNYSNEYKPMTGYPASAQVGFDDETGRIVSQTTINIKSINDPWKDVCRDILDGAMFFYQTDPELSVGFAIGLFDQIQAPRSEKIATYLQIMNSILVRLIFFNNNDEEYHARVCEYDARTKQYNFIDRRGAMPDFG